eukprot:scaffold73084_cov35-Attheya_sp.AAC.1
MEHVPAISHKRRSIGSFQTQNVKVRKAMAIISIDSHASVMSGLLSSECMCRVVSCRVVSCLWRDPNS